MRILAIESTCDETGAAVVEGDVKEVKVLTNVVASSAEIQQNYGGVVPEVAAREQLKYIVPVIDRALKGINRKTLDALAVTYGPGLVGSLLIGIETVKALAWVWNKPIVRVNHMVGHLAANWIAPTVLQLDGQDGTPEFPAVGLIVSGGHTDLIYMEDKNRWDWVGGTRDDAAGEAFDKGARILGLPYPGGPSIQKAAERAVGICKVKLPRPMLDQDNFEMSFSGLKAALAKAVNDDTVDLLAKEFNEAIVDVLITKTMKVVDKFRPKSLLVAGGVAANKTLRERIGQITGVKVFIPELKYCTDNAAMIGAAAILRPDYVATEKLKPVPGLTVV